MRNSFSRESAKNMPCVGYRTPPVALFPSDSSIYRGCVMIKISQEGPAVHSDNTLNPQGPMSQCLISPCGDNSPPQG